MTERSKTVSRILQAMQATYGSLAEPRFDFVLAAIKDDPHRQLVLDLREEAVEVVEDTEPNDDVSFGFLLKRATEVLLVRVSMIGPYAVVMRPSSTVVDRWEPLQVIDNKAVPATRLEGIVADLLENERLQILSSETLRAPVRLSLSNTEPEQVTLYQGLFTDGEFPGESVDSGGVEESDTPP